MYFFITAQTWWSRCTDWRIGQWIKENLSCFFYTGQGAYCTLQSILRPQSPPRSHCLVSKIHQQLSSKTKQSQQFSLDLSDINQIWVTCFWELLVASLQSNKPLPTSGALLQLHPFLDKDGILRMGGRQENSKLLYSKLHLIVLHWKHPIAKLLICSEHKRLRLLHGEPSFVITSLSRPFHIINARKLVRSITRQCVICRRQTIKPQLQMFRQLPFEKITPGLVKITLDSVFERVGLDYAGPFLDKYGYVWKPTIVKSYLYIFVSLTVKAIHLELVSDLTSGAFTATLLRFVARGGYPSLLWSDHGTPFVGANCELIKLNMFLKKPSHSTHYICVLFYVKYRVEVHSWALYTLWWIVGVYSQECQDSSP